MSTHNGQVTMNDAPTKSRLARFCQKQIDQWLRKHPEAAGTEDGSGASFRVAFADEDGTEQVSCMTEINLCGTVWRGCDLAGDEQQAFIHSLKRLHPN